MRIIILKIKTWMEYENYKKFLYIDTIFSLHETGYIFILYITTNPLRSNKNIYIPMYTTKIYELLQTE